MGKPSLRKLIRQLLHLGRGRSQPRKTAGSTRLLCIEQLENRTVLSTIQPIASGLQLPPSDSAGGASQIMISANGRYTAYTSTAPNLAPGQVNTAVASNVFLYDQQTGTTTLVSHVPGAAATGANGNSEVPRISGDGRFVAYESTATNLVAGQNGPSGQFNVFLFDRTTGTNTLVSHRAGSTTTSGDDVSFTLYATGFGFNSNSGQFLLFNSAANDLVTGQSGPTHENVYLYNTASQTTTLVSHNSSSTLTRANGDSVYADLTPDGSAIVFQSFAGDVVSGQTGTLDNIFLYNTGSGTSQLISGVASGAGNSSTNAAGFSMEPLISADGSLITYLSRATNLVAGQATSGTVTSNVFAYLTTPGTTTLVSGANGSSQVTANGDANVLTLSSDGSTIAFVSDATDLTSGQGNTTGNAFVYTTGTGALVLASHVSNSTTTAAGGVYNNPSFTYTDLSLSGDGRFLAYISTAKLAGQSGPSGTKNVYLYDGQSGQNTLGSQVNGSPTTPGDYDTNFSRISDDGSTVAFLSLANNLDPGVNIADGGQNLFLFDVTTDAGPTLGSRSAFQASATSLVYGSSGDGRFVLFSSNAPNVVPHQNDYNFDQDLFLLDRTTGVTTLVSHVPGGGGTTTGNLGSPTSVGFVDIFATPVISNDGNFVAFVSQANNLVAGEVAPVKNDQVYLYNRLTGTVTLLSHTASSTATTGDDVADSPAISADGRYVVFRSLADDLLPGGIILPSAVRIPNVFLVDTVAGTITLVSHNAGNAAESGDSGSAYPVISDDGRYVAYPSRATTLVAGATIYPTENDFLYDRLSGSNTLVSHVVGNPLLSPNPATAPGTPPTVASTNSVISPDGSTIAYASFATNLVAGQSGVTDTTDVFVYHVATGTNQLASGTGGSASAEANNYSDSPALNANGSEVAFRSSATNLVTGQVNTAGGTSNIFLFNPQNVPAIVLASHAAGANATTAAGDSTVPRIDGPGGLIVYLSTATNLVPGQVGGGVNNTFLYVPVTAANVLVSGQGGSPFVASANPTFLPIISRDPAVFFNILSGAGAASAGFSNTLIQVFLSQNTVPDGSPPDSLVGTLNVTGSFYAGAFLPPTYTLPANEDNNASFSAFNIGLGQANVFTGFTPNFALQQSYLLSVHVNFNIVDLSDVPGTLPVVVGAPGSPAKIATAGNGIVVADLPGQGVWRYEDATLWEQLTTINAAEVGVDANGDVAALLPGLGAWRYEDASGWVQLTASNVLQVGIAGNGIVTALLAIGGVWRYEDVGGWKQLTASNATQIGVDANGDVLATLLNGGVWRFEDARGWQLLTTSNPVQVSIAGNGIVVAAFQGGGVWRFEDAAGWGLLTGASASGVSVDAQGDVAALLAGGGLWRYEDALGWQLLTATNPVQAGIGGNGNVVAELLGFGVWRYETAAGWLQLTGTDAG